MAKLPITTRRTANLLLQHIANNVGIGDGLPTEMWMSAHVACSRTVVRGALSYFVDRGLISGMQERYLLRKPSAEDYFEVAALHCPTEQLQQTLMAWIYARELPPGAEFSVAELSRVAGVSTVAVREFLIGFSRNGLIEKNARGGWRLCAFDTKYALDLGEARAMFEVEAIERIARLAPGDPVFLRLKQLLAQHEALGKAPAGAQAQWPALEREFHAVLIGLLNNRFADQLNELVSMVWHYHYQWEQRGDIPGSQSALREHLAILRPLAGGDVAAALAALRAHLRPAAH